MNGGKALYERRSSNAGFAHDYVILAESHMHSISAPQLAEERAWIRANGPWISDQALAGDAQHGQGFVYLPWQIGDASGRKDTARFRGLRDYVDTANQSHSFDAVGMRRPDGGRCARTPSLTTLRILLSAG